MSNDQTVWVARNIRPVVLQWGAIRAGQRHECHRCGVVLLTGEQTGCRYDTNGIHLNDILALFFSQVNVQAFVVARTAII
jgi:hypothetical protein